MKLKNVQAYKKENVPDHIIEEITQLAEKMSKALFPFLIEKDPNIAMGALSYFHAASLKYLISLDPEQCRKAAKLNALGLIENMELLIKQAEKE